VLSVPKITMTQLGGPPTGPLSPRELEVLDLVAQGLSNGQIGTRLRISEGTVKRHLTNIYLKLDVRSRTNAINKAAALRLL
jgi:ATP/maltotriose-dependent transcriptional regulator MalT